MARRAPEPTVVVPPHEVRSTTDMALARSLAHELDRPLPVPARGSHADLRARFRGALVLPGDPAYEAGRRSWNGAFDRRPTVIARPVDAHDVSAAVRFARAADLDLAVRSGGHSLAGHSTTDGGLLLDLGELRGLHIDPHGATAWVGTGLTAGDVTRAAHDHGLVVPFGDTATVGVGGITLGGGIGWLVRKHGMTIDSLLAAEIVTADGDVLTVSDERHPDLFWAIRGGGGNFGVVTRFQYRLHPLGTVLGGILALPLSRDVLTGLVEVASAAPEELSTISFITHVPPLPVVAPEHHGKPAVLVSAVWSGDLEAGQEALAPLRSLGTPLADLIGPMPYPTMYELVAPPPGRRRFAGHSALAGELPDAVADGIVEAMSDRSSLGAMVQLRVLGGAMARVPSDLTAFGHRDRRLVLMAGFEYESVEQAPVAEAFAASMAGLIRPISKGVYSNFLGNEESRIGEAYPEATYRRLATVKRAYDPTNVFRLNQNIRPA
jgi:FAD/FMN-containing dehydrogenase